MDIILLILVLSGFLSGFIAVYYYIVAIRSIFGSVFSQPSITEYIQVFVLNTEQTLDKSQLRKRKVSIIWIAIFISLIVFSRFI